jgi:hypothetical protein
MIDQLMMTFPDLLVTQQLEWLHKWGIDELVSEGNKYWDEHKSAPDIYAMKMRSRANEYRALNAMSEVGMYKVISLDRVIREFD